MAQVRCRLVLGLVMAVGLTPLARAQGLPLFEAGAFDRMEMAASEAAAAIALDRIKATGSRSILRYTAPTAIRRAGRAVGQIRVELQTPNGPVVVACTGSLIGQGLVLTAYRCLPGVLADPNLSAKGATAVLRAVFVTDFDALVDGNLGQRHALSIVPVAADRELGYAVLSVKMDTDLTVAPLVRAETVPPKGAPLTLVGHPLGAAKQVLRRGCTLREAVTQDGQILHGCATLPGMAGAPILDDKGHLIGLHLKDQPKGRGVVFPAQWDAAPAPQTAELAESSVVPELAPAKEGEADMPPDPDAEAPTVAFPVGVHGDGPAVYGVALPYLPPGTGVELVTGPLGDLSGPDAKTAVSGAGLAASLTRLEARFTVLSLWRSADGALLARKFLPLGIEALALSTDGATLALARHDGQARWVEVLEVPALEQVNRIDLPTGPVSALTYTVDGAGLALASGDPVRLSRLEFETGKFVQGGDGLDGVLSSVGAPDGGLDHAVPAPEGVPVPGHVTGDAPGLARFDPQSGDRIGFLPRQPDEARALAFSPDSTRLAISGTGVPLQVWAWQEGFVTFARADGAVPQVLAWSPSGSGLASQAMGGALLVDDFDNPPRSLSGAADPRALSYSDDGRFLARTDAAGSVSILEAATGQVVRAFPGDFAAFSRDAKLLAVARNGAEPAVTLSEVESGAGVVQLQMPFSALGPIAFRGPEAEVVGVAYTKGASAGWVLAVWNAEDGTLLRRFGGIETAPSAMAISHDGRFAAVAQHGSPDVLLWDLSVGRFLWRLPTGGAEVRALAFAPDGLRIAAGLAPGGAVLWDMINGQVKARLANWPDGTVAQVDATLFLSDPTLLERVAVRLPDGSFLPAAQVLRDGLPDFAPADLPLDEQVKTLLARLRAGDEDARLLLVDGRAMAFDLEFRKEMQRQLKAQEFYSGAIDGDIGRGSRKALELFAAAEES
ncbi:trypsin-like peptidase domain-containing protein [Mameliella alba]|nr:trypsin-like peptidase domain-containing protein [Antarctobacter heliothermus]MBY6146428.1 trypsin-like peptidase domain-containing protein [Mameliella alba]MCA0955827.1 trypsin-like peptidase domain-containing protein [Mameliella alba]